MDDILREESCERQPAWIGRNERIIADWINAGKGGCGTGHAWVYKENVGDGFY